MSKAIYLMLAATLASTTANAASVRAVSTPASSSSVDLTDITMDIEVHYVHGSDGVPSASQIEQAYKRLLENVPNGCGFLNSVNINVSYRHIGNWNAMSKAAFYDSSGPGASIMKILVLPVDSPTYMVNGHDKLDNYNLYSGPITEVPSGGHPFPSLYTGWDLSTAGGRQCADLLENDLLYRVGCRDAMHVAAFSASPTWEGTFPQMTSSDQKNSMPTPDIIEWEDMWLITTAHTSDWQLQHALMSMMYSTGAIGDALTGSLAHDSCRSTGSFIASGSEGEYPSGEDPDMATEGYCGSVFSKTYANSYPDEIGALEVDTLFWPMSTHEECQFRNTIAVVHKNNNTCSNLEYNATMGLSVNLGMNDTRRAWTWEVEDIQSLYGHFLSDGTPAEEFVIDLTYDPARAPKEARKFDDTPISSEGITGSDRMENEACCPAGVLKSDCAVPGNVIWECSASISFPNGKVKTTGVRSVYGAGGTTGTGAGNGKWLLQRDVDPSAFNTPVHVEENYEGMPVVEYECHATHPEGGPGGRIHPFEDPALSDEYCAVEGTIEMAPYLVDDQGPFPLSMWPRAYVSSFDIEYSRFGLVSGSSGRSDFYHANPTHGGHTQFGYGPSMLSVNTLELDWFVDHSPVGSPLGDAAECAALDPYDPPSTMEVYLPVGGDAFSPGVVPWFSGSPFGQYRETSPR